MSKINEAMTLARIAHAGMKYGDSDYFETHVMDVARRVEADPETTDEKIATAYLHDVVEDTSVTLDDLTALGFPWRIVYAVEAITRTEDETYFEYIERVSENRIAAFVKRHDLMSNINENTPISMKTRNMKALEMLS